MKYITCKRNSIYSVTSGIEIIMVPVEVRENMIGEKLTQDMATCLGAIWTLIQSPKCSVEQIVYPKRTEKKDMELKMVIAIHAVSRNEREALGTLRQTYRILMDYLVQNGYRLKEMGKEELIGALSRRTGNGIAVQRKAQPFRTMMGMQGSSYVPFGKSLTQEILYKTILQNNNNCFTLQLTPSVISEGDKNVLRRQFMSSSCFASGIQMNGFVNREMDAVYTADNLQYYYKRMNGPMFRVNSLFHGTEAVQMASVFSGALSNMDGAPAVTEKRTIMAFPKESAIAFYPWDVEHYINAIVGERDGMKSYLKHTHSAEEVSNLMLLPVSNEAYSPYPGNAFSLLNLSKPANKMTKKDEIFLGYSSDGTQVYLPVENLKYNLNIFGCPGTGKTTLIKNLLYHLRQKGINTLVVECEKNEFRSLIDLIPETKIFHVKNAGIEMRLNPFLPCDGVPLSRYLPYLREAFRAAFVLEAPLDSLVEKAIGEAYTKFGWKSYSKIGDPDVTCFTLRDFVSVLKEIIEQSSYEKKLKGNLNFAGEIRLLRLLETSAASFDTMNATPMSESLSGSSVVNVSNITGEDLSVLVAMLLLRLVVTIKATYGKSERLRTVLVIDEAHTFLDIDGNASASAVILRQMIENMVATFRGLGIGVIVSDQVPSRVGKNIISCASSNIVLKLGNLEEANLMRGQLQLDDVGAQALVRLDLGQLVMTTPGQMTALPVFSENFDAKHRSRSNISDKEINERYKVYCRKHALELIPYDTCRSCPMGVCGCNQEVHEKANIYAKKFYETYKNQIVDMGSLHRAISSLRNYIPEKNNYSLMYCTASVLCRTVFTEQKVNISSITIQKLIHGALGRKGEKNHG